MFRTLAEPGPWGGWSECSVTCGNGLQSRWRATCTDPPAGIFHGLDPSFKLTETKKCYMNSCPGKAVNDVWNLVVASLQVQIIRTKLRVSIFHVCLLPLLICASSLTMSGPCQKLSWSVFSIKSSFHLSVKSSFVFFYCDFWSLIACLECLPSWSLFMDSCYKVHTSPNTWDVAVQKCLDLNSNLVDITNSEENTFVANLVATAGFDRAWIGLSDRQQENLFVWTDGSYSNFTNWEGVEPNGMTNENCVFIRGHNSQWVDAGCSRSYRSICEKTGWLNLSKFSSVTC